MLCCKCYSSFAPIQADYPPLAVPSRLHALPSALQAEKTDPETTLIYAYADTEMKRQAIEKASANTPIPETGDESPVWESQDIIERLIRGY